MAVPILVYHRITDFPTPELRYYAVRPRAFRRQMRVLRLTGWRTTTVGEVVRAREEGRKLPSRTVAISFDDAYAELEREALPVLAANSQTATIYACPGLLGAAADELRGDDLHEDATLMDAAALRRVKAARFAVESHTLTHPRLSSLDAEGLTAELEGSRRRLAEVLDSPVDHLAYPYGDYDDGVAAAARTAGYGSAVTTDPGLVADQSPWELPRLYVSWGEGASRVLARLARGATGSGS